MAVDTPAMGGPTAWEKSGIVTDIIRGQAKLRGAVPAILFQGRTATYHEIDERSNQVANGLISEGVEAQDRVGLLASNCDTYLEILFGCLKAGAVFVPLNHRLSGEEIRAVLIDAQLKVLFVQAVYAPVVRPIAADLPGLKLVIVISEEAGGLDYEAWRTPQSTRDPGREAHVQDDAFQIYSSGTTGVPKGIRLTHRNYQVAISSALVESYAQLGPAGRLLHCSPLFHVAGINFALYALAQGATLCLLERAEPLAIVDAIEKDRASHGLLVPTVMRMIVQSPGIETRDLSAMRSITYGASPIAEDLLETIRALFRNAELSQCYGMTESTGAGTVLRPADHDPARGKLRSVGRAAVDLELRVVGRDGTVASPREVGEIEIRSETVTKGYWRKPEVTAETMHDGWLRTGDAGYMDEDGYVYLHDRVKDMIISGGENIYPAEVENVLSAHAAVADVAVIGIPSERWGEEPKAFVVLRPGASLAFDDLVAFARKRLAGYKLPKSLEIVTELPKNAGGKTLRRVLKRPYWENLDRKV